MVLQPPENASPVHRYSGKDLVGPIAKWKVNLKQVHNIDYLYLYLHDWIIEQKWVTEDDENFPEFYYQQRDTPGSGKELRIRWRLKWDSLEEKSKFFRYIIDLQIYTLGLKETEINWKGQKISAHTGEIEIDCSAYLEIDYEGVWKDSIFKPFVQLFQERIRKQQFDMHKKQVYMSAYRLRDFFLNYMKQQGISPEKEAEPYVKHDFE